MQRLIGRLYARVGNTRIEWVEFAPTVRFETIVRVDDAIDSIGDAVECGTNRFLGLSARKTPFRFETDQPTVVAVIPRINQQCDGCACVASLDACIPSPIFHQWRRFALDIRQRQQACIDPTRAIAAYEPTIDLVIRLFVKKQFRAKQYEIAVRNSRGSRSDETVVLAGERVAGSFPPIASMPRSCDVSRHGQFGVRVIIPTA